MSSMSRWENWWSSPTIEEVRESSTVNRFVRKNQLAFAKYFLPKHIFSVQLAYLDEEDDNIIRVTGRVKPPHHSTKGKTQKFDIDVNKYRVWEKNVSLYTFVSG